MRDTGGEASPLWSILRFARTVAKKKYKIGWNYSRGVAGAMEMVGDGGVCSSLSAVLDTSSATTERLRDRDELKLGSMVFSDIRNATQMQNG